MSQHRTPEQRHHTREQRNARSRARFRTACAVFLTLAALPAALGQQEDRSGSFCGSFTIRGKNTCNVTDSRGIWGWTSATTGRTHGVYGQSDSRDGMGVLGRATNTSSLLGRTFGVAGQADGPKGYGVFGAAISTTGTTYGVYGTAASATGRGVFGESTTGNGLSFGVYGKVNNANANGVGVYGYAASGVGVRAESGATGVAAEVLGAAEFFGLAGGPAGGSISLYNGAFGATQPTIWLSGSGGKEAPENPGAGFMQMYGPDGNRRVQLFAGVAGNGALPNSGVRLFNSAGDLRVNLEGDLPDNSAGGAIELYSGSSTDAAQVFTALIDAGGTNDGGQVRLFNGQATNRETIRLDGNGNAAGGRMTLFNGAGSQTIDAYGDIGNGAPEFHLYDNGVSTVALNARHPDGPSGGTMILSNPQGEPTVKINAYPPGTDPEFGGNIKVSRGDAFSGQINIAAGFDGSNTIPYISMQNDSAASTIVLNGGTGAVSATCFSGPNCDLAESFDLTNPESVQPGMVMVMDAASSARLTVSTKAYDGLVAGIVSGAGGLQPGVVLGRGSQSAESDSTLTPALSLPGRGSDLPIALSGRVYCLVDATQHAVAVGDMLTTSDTPGHAMKAADRERAFGAVIGKAMQPLEKGKKELVLVLVALQ